MKKFIILTALCCLHLAFFAQVPSVAPDGDDAEEMYKVALEIQQRLANDNPQAYERDLAFTLNNLALLYFKTQRLTDAEEKYKQALEIQQRLANDNPQVYEPDLA